MTSSDDTLAWRLEHLFLNAFPAPIQVQMGDMVARLGGGVSRRASSISPLRADLADFEGTLAACAPLYTRRGLPCRVRVPALLDPAVDRHLEGLGYGRECDVRTLLAPDLPNGGPATPAVSLIDHPSERWLIDQARLKGFNAAKATDLRASLAALGIPALFATLWSEDGATALAQAFGGIQGGILAVEGVVTDPAHRGKGLARRLLLGLLAGAQAQGATAAGLQVESENAPALALYARLGFTEEFHRYHFRRGPDPDPLVG